MEVEQGCQRIDIDEAEALVHAHGKLRPITRVPLGHAFGEILREPVLAERDQPPFDRVTMDGYALRESAFTAGRRSYTVVATQAAGAPAATIGDEAGCVWIMTGAALPTDADTIVPVERTRRDGDTITIEDGYTPVAGQFIHRAGSDHRAGSRLLAPGVRLGPPETAVLTIGGHAAIGVASRPAIAVVSTGDELVDVGEPITTFRIRSSNDRAVVAALAGAGFRQVSRRRLPDDPVVLERELRDLLAEHDVLVLSGGVSMGEYDHVPRTLAALGVRVVFHKVRQRPGGPFWFGTTTDGRPVFALPGNPVSTLVCLVRYVIPALIASLGATPSPAVRVPLASEVRFEPDLGYFLPVVLSHGEDGSLRAVPRPTNTSGDFVALAGTDGFVELPRGGKVFPPGYAARFFRW